MKGRSLTALINDEIIGELHEANGIWAFEYAHSWVTDSNGFALSPHLPLQTASIQDTGTHRHVQWYFDNLLPEEGQRLLLAGDAKIDSADAFGLLGYYGSESAGSITLVTPDQFAQRTVERGLQPLPDENLSQRIQAMPAVPLAHTSKKKMSLAGAQHKLAINYKNDGIYEPVGETPSTHILKPNHPDNDYAHSVINEYFVMRLAKTLGLDVPSVYRRYVPEPVYLIERFDRKENVGTYQRVHAIDACQLLGLDRNYKYVKGSMATLAELANACRSPAVARVRLFTWLVFNILIGNTDAHLKNLSFVVNKQGIQLAPHYDMLSTACYETQAFGKADWPTRSNFAWPMLYTDKFSDINRTLLLDAGNALMINRNTVLRLIENISGRIAQKAQDLYDEISIENAELKRQRPELGIVFEGELRCLRTIQFSIIRDMLDKMK